MSDPSPAGTHPRCINLSCKSMLVFGEGFENDPDYQAGMVEFWCIRTSKGQGPDGATASMANCCNPERSCYQEY
jgi:hypothetical protein